MINTSLQNFLRSRRSVRKFKDTPVDNHILAEILHTALYAPSAHHRQPWRFAVISSPNSKHKLVEAMSADFRRDLERDRLPPAEIETRLDRSANRIFGAPVVIVLSMDESDMDAYPDSQRASAETVMATQSTALAGLQLLLAAHAEGIAGVWTCGPLFAPATVKLALGLPESWQPQAMFFLGYAGETPKPKELKQEKDLILWV